MTQPVSPDNPLSGFGPNEWIVEEMYQRYLSDPSSVDPSWHDFFADYRMPDAQTAAAPPTAATTTTPPPTPPAPKLALPQLVDDGVHGPDLLGIRDDALALAGVIASRETQPPLALGIFGRWGSGKSFFMTELDRLVGRLADERDPAVFCSNVTSIWFNAWHYSDGNIWASLLQHIFASLHDKRGSVERMVDEAMNRVQSAQIAQEALAEQVRVAQAVEREAKLSVEELERRHERLVAEAAAVSARDVFDQIRLDDGIRNELSAVARDLGLPEVAGQGRELVDGIAQLRDLGRRATVLATTRENGRWWTAPLYRGLLVAGCAALIGLGGSWALTELGRETLAPIVGVLGQVGALAAGAAAFLSRQADLVRRVLNPAEEAQRQIDERVEQVRKENAAREEDARAAVRRAEAALARAEDDFHQAHRRSEACRVELAELRGNRLLHRYLAGRAESDDYAKHLGVVTLAHRDLQDLISILANARTEPDGAAPPDRIILFIDDLDRCPSRTVVQVLEAIHLLLALPLFVVVVGVDAGWLKQSLRDRHSLLLGDNGNPATATADDYLEKIFQLTFTLPALTPQQCAVLLHRTAGRDDVAPTPSRATGATTGNAPVPAAAELPTAETFAISPVELITLGRVAVIVGQTPRRAKRFLNVYRVVRARHSGRLRDGSPEERQALAVVVALAVGLPRWAPAALDALAGAADGITLAQWLAERPEHPGAQPLHDALGRLREMPVALLRGWVPLVRPFAWPIPERSPDGLL